MVLCLCSSHFLLIESTGMLPGYKSAQIVVQCPDSPYITDCAYLYSHSWISHFYLCLHFFFSRTSIFLGVESTIFVKAQFMCGSVNRLKATSDKLNVTLVGQRELNLLSALQYFMSFMTSPGTIYVNSALKSASVRWIFFLINCSEQWQIMFAYNISYLILKYLFVLMRSNIFVSMYIPTPNPMLTWINVIGWVLPFIPYGKIKF